MKKNIILLVILIVISSQLVAQDWNYVTNSGTNFILYGMSFPKNQSDIGYACGMKYTFDSDGVIVKTTDGGDNWTTIWPSSGTIDGLQGIWFIDENTGFAGGWNNYFIKTIDGGVSWTTISCGTNVWYYVDVEFWDTDNGVAAAMMNTGDQAIFITNDGGDTWIPATSGADVNIMGLCYADQYTLFAVGLSENIFKSIDGGHNWTVLANLGAWLLGVDFANTTFGVVGGEEKMFATNDGGASWSTYTTGYENFYATKAYEDGTAYVGGTDNRIHKTTDYGNTWVLDSAAGSSSLYRIRETDDGDLFACGSQGTILKKENLSSSVIENNNDFIDFTIYPNPTDGIVNIKFSIEINENYTITIQSLLGQVISTIDGVGSGEDEILKINTTDMSQGQYILAINRNNKKSSYKNFVVMR